MAVPRYFVTIALVLFACTTPINAQVSKWNDILPPPGTFDNNPKNFNILAALVDYSGLTKGDFELRYSTVFAPTDDAFINFMNKYSSFKGRNESLAFQAIKREAQNISGSGPKGPALVEAVLLYHVVPYPMTKKHILANSYVAPTLLDGKNILLTKSPELVDGMPVALNPIVTKADIQVVDNNTVHVINGLLLPDLTVQ